MVMNQIDTKLSQKLFESEIMENLIQGCAIHELQTWIVEEFRELKSTPLKFAKLV